MRDIEIHPISTYFNPGQLLSGVVPNLNFWAIWGLYRGCSPEFGSSESSDKSEKLSGNLIFTTTVVWLGSVFKVGGSYCSSRGLRVPWLECNCVKTDTDCCQCCVCHLVSLLPSSFSFNSKHTIDIAGLNTNKQSDKYFVRSKVHISYNEQTRVKVGRLCDLLVLDRNICTLHGQPATYFAYPSRTFRKC